MNEVEIMDCVDLVEDLDLIATEMRSDYFGPEDYNWSAIADEITRAADKLHNLAKRLRIS